MNSEQKSSSGMLEQEIFVGALAKTNTDTRAAFLDAACGEDNKLRDRIEALLREQAKADDFLEATVVAAPGGEAARRGPGVTVVIPATEKAGDRIGRYKILQQIGEGGCGVVYMAEQEERWTPIFRPRVSFDFCRFAVDKKEQTYESKTETTQCGLQGQSGIRSPGGA
jgi:hypothetical protein